MMNDESSWTYSPMQYAISNQKINASPDKSQLGEAILNS